MKIQIKIIIIFVAIGLLLPAFTMLSCNSSKKITEPKPVSHFPLETDPSLSLDHSQLLYVSIDTVVTQNSGLYKADINLPIRKLILKGDTFTSPTTGFDLNKIAYLNNGELYYYLINSDSSFSSTITQQFQSITYFSDSLILATDGNNIFLVNEPSSRVDSLTVGYDPNFFAADSFLYIAAVTSASTAIMMTDINLSFVDTLVISSKLDAMRYPSLSPDRNWLAFSRLDNGDRFLYLIENISSTGPTFERKLRQCYSDKVLIIEPNVILHTGSNGLIWETDYFGSYAIIYGVTRNNI